MPVTVATATAARTYQCARSVPQPTWPSARHQTAATSRATSSALTELVSGPETVTSPEVIRARPKEHWKKGKRSSSIMRQKPLKANTERIDQLPIPFWAPRTNDLIRKEKKTDSELPAPSSIQYNLTNTTHTPSTPPPLPTLVAHTCTCYSYTTLVHIIHIHTNLHNIPIATSSSPQRRRPKNKNSPNKLCNSVCTFQPRLEIIDRNSVYRQSATLPCKFPRPLLYVLRRWIEQIHEEKIEMWTRRKKTNKNNFAHRLPERKYDKKK